MLADHPCVGVFRWDFGSEVLHRQVGPHPVSGYVGHSTNGCDDIFICEVLLRHVQLGEDPSHLQNLDLILQPGHDLADPEYHGVVILIQLQDQVLRTGAIQVPLTALATGPELLVVGVSQQEPRP